jgi:predicted RNase H-like HicB family nuclease
VRYTVIIVPDGELGGYVAYVPVVGVTTQGETIDEALAMAEEATGLMLDVLTEDGEEIPTGAPGVIVGSIEPVLGESTPVGVRTAAATAHVASTRA